MSSEAAPEALGRQPGAAQPARSADRTGAALPWRSRVLLFLPAAAVFAYTVWHELLSVPLDPALQAPLSSISAVLIAACAIAVCGRGATLAMTAAVLVFVGARLSLGVIDDGYIALRYAHNFANGMGLDWNAGEHVEGYSGFLWVWLLGTLRRIHPWFDIVTTSQLLGVSASLIALLFTQRCAYLLSSVTTERDPGTLLLLGAHFPLVFWSYSGMETGLCVCLLTAAVYATCRYLIMARPTVSGSMLASLAWVLAMMTRPELTLLFAGSAAFVVVRGERRGPALAYCIPPLLVYVPYFIWRYQYYGWLLPNTYYVKVGTPFSQLPFATKYLLTGLLPHMVLVPFVVRALRRRDPGIVYVASMLGLLLLTILIAGADHFSEWRSFTYALPLLYMLAHGELSRVLAVSTRVAPALQWPVRALTLACVSWMFFVTTFAFARVGINTTLYDGANGARAWGALGQYFARTTPKSFVLASPVIGALGYYSERTLIDMVGLTDVTIAHARLPPGTAPGPKDHAQFDSAYVMRRKPDGIYLLSSEPSEQAFLQAHHWVPAIQDLKRYFPNPDYRYELLSGPLGRYALYLRKPVH